MEKYIWRITDNFVPVNGFDHEYLVFFAPQDTLISGIKWDLKFIVMNVKTDDSGFSDDSHYFIAWAMATSITQQYKGGIHLIGADDEFFLPSNCMIVGGFEPFTTQTAIQVTQGTMTTEEDAEISDMNFLGEVNALPANLDQVLSGSITVPNTEFLLETRQDTTRAYTIIKVKGRTPVSKKLRKGQALYLHFKTNWTSTIPFSVMGIIQHNAQDL